MNNYEAHITINEDVTARPDWFLYCNRAFAFGNPIKPLFIQLERGDYRNQLMSSIPFKARDDDDALRKATELHMIINKDWPVKRIKVETPLHEASPIAIYAYYELHLKCMVSPDKVDVVSSFASSDIGVSEAFIEGLELDQPRKMYLTQRHKSVRPLEALKYFANTYTIYEPLVSKFEAEMVLWDSNPETDKGWFVGD